MRKTAITQLRFDTVPIHKVPLNLECRDSIIPILKALQHVYAERELTTRILGLIAADINPESRTDTGREGLAYWQICVLSAVRLGCNITYDQLQDLGENHRTLRAMMGLGECDEQSFHHKTLRNTFCLLRPDTIDQISHAIVQAGHALEPDAITKALQKKFGNRVKRLSFDRGFHSPDNQTELASLVDHPCLPKPGAKQSLVQLAEADDEFLSAQQHHPGVESAIGALQSGNGLKRCRDRSEAGLERYLRLAILGRNLHTLGRLLIAREHSKAAAGQTRRQAA